MRNLAIVAVAAALVVGAFALAGPRPAGEYQLLLRLNGEPKKLGHIVITDAGSVSNAGTAEPFTLSGGEVLEVVCNTAACVRPGAAPDGGAVVNCTYADLNMGVLMTAGSPRWFALQEGTTTFTAVPNGSAATTCSVAVMR